jgi:uncharacterized protein (TIGR02300 family)
MAKRPLRRLLLFARGFGAFGFDSAPSAWQVSRRFRPTEDRPLANPELGAKQICPTCQSKFYDLGKRPAVCPKCGASFDPEEAVRNRRIRARTAVPDYEEAEEKPEKVKDEDVEGFEDEADDTPEIDQAVEADPIESDDDADEAPAAPPADDLGVDFAEDEELAEDDEDVPFLEDEEEDFPEDEIEGLPEEGDAEDR